MLCNVRSKLQPKIISGNNVPEALSRPTIYQKAVRITPVIVSIILASSTLGIESAMGDASSGMTSPGQSTPCTASHPCQAICGDHPCAPGEVYTPGGTAAKANATASGTNGTKTPSLSTQMSMGANVTATKIANGTNANATGAPLKTGMGISENLTATKITKGTMKETKNMTGNTVPPPAPIVPPAKQVSSGVQPADVKCPSGFQLALNKFNQRPACVTPDVLAKLVARGWAVTP